MKPKTFRTIMLFLAILAIIIIISIFAYIIFNSKPTQKCPIQIENQIGIDIPNKNTSSDLTNRDRRVLNDDLYPPLNRTDDQTFNSVTTNPNINQVSNPNQDSFRLIGYLTNHDTIMDKGGNNWKLFGRMKDKYQGEYYIVPANNNLDIKIPLTSDVVVGERLRDIYTLPSEMRFKSPMLNTGSYEYVEMPKTDFTNSKYV